MDTFDDSEDLGPTAAKRMRVAEVNVENVNVEFAVETEQRAKVTITPDDEEKRITDDLMENECEQSEVQQGVTKYNETKQDGEGVKSAPTEELLLCQAPNCDQKFVSVIDYDIHYNTRHRHVCSECKKPLATPHLLELHVLERHDTFFAILAERKPMFSCLEETCSLKFKNSEERLEHCVAEHKFLKTFRLGGKPKAFKQETKDVAPKLVHSHGDNNNKEISHTSPEASKTSTNTKKPKQSVIKEAKGSSTTAPDISFGRHSVRFIPRQVFAMPKKQSKTKTSKISASNESNQEMTDLNDLHAALQGSCSESASVQPIGRGPQMNDGGASSDAGMEL